MNETLVLVNPAAGGARAGELWQRLRAEAESLAPLRVATPDSAEAARAAVLEAAAAGCERIVAFGGDGTAHLIVGALLAAGAGTRVTLGIVPAGTGSDLARALAIPRDPRLALARALTGAPRPLDGARCDGERASFYFVNIASAGVSGQVDAMVNAMPGRGTTAFLGATLRALRTYRCVEVRVAVDGAPWYEGPILVLAVANGTTFGKGMRVAPLAAIDDGVFDVVVAGAVSGVELPLRLGQLYFGRHLHARPVRSCRAREVRLEPLGTLPVFDADGETYPSGPATFTILPGALRVAG